MTERVPRLFVVAVTDSAGCAVVHSALVDLLGAGEVRRINDAAWLAYAERHDAAAIRDRIAPLADGVSVFVAEFERWSAGGDAVDRAWLLRRGH